MDRQCEVEGCGAPAKTRGWCVKHYTRWLRHGDPKSISRNPPSTEDAVEKRCPRCNVVKPIAEFGTRPSGKPKGYCRTCEAHYQKRYASTEHGAASHRAASAKWHGENGRDYQLSYRYGISQDDFDRMLEEQSGRCAICGTTPESTLHVDHCHDTLNVRGLLCTKCNIGIGYFNDDVEVMKRAIAYLES